MRKTTVTVLAIAAILSVPLLSGGVMQGPDPGVSADWQGSQIAQAQNNQGGQGAPDNQAQGVAGGVFERGTFDFKGTITGVDRDNRTFAVNGMWINPQRWIDLALAADLRVTGVPTSTMVSVWNGLQVGDRIQIRGDLASGEIRIAGWDVKRDQSAEMRRHIETRLEQLRNQLNRLVEQLRGRGVDLTLPAGGT